METIIQKQINQKIKELPEFLMEELSEYIDFLLYKSKNDSSFDKEMTIEEFQNWVKKAEQGNGMSLDEFESKWENKESEILNRTN